MKRVIVSGGGTGGQILTAEVTYKDGSVEILSTTVRK